MTLHELWQAALGEIELNVSKANFITWFNGTKILDNRNGTIIITVPSAFNKDWLENKYNKVILKALRNISPDVKKVEFIIFTDKTKQTKNTKIQKDESKSPVYSSDLLKEQSSFQEINETKIDKETNLNPKYTFDNFIVGSFNDLAFAAAQAIIKNLGQAYNPLFIYGGVGLGKTHLLQSIGNEVIKNYNGQKKVKYLSGEKFTTELIDALTNRTMQSFKEYYRRNTDVLIVDDIQFIAGKEKVQEEFFHTFNNLYQKNKQIIISSDRPPTAISTLEDRLKSRFGGGMIVDISYPDLETRVAILKIKIKEHCFDLSNDILIYIANQSSKNIRELEGILNRIIINAKIRNIIPTESQIKKDLNYLTINSKKKTNYKTIIEAVANFYDIDLDYLVNKSRKKEVVWPRQIAMFLLREEIKSSFPFIGEKLGGRDHTTVMYACEKLKKQLNIDEALRQEINLIKEKIYNN